MQDLLVVGAGLSGLTAAYSAAKAGLNVKIVSKGLGLMHWSAGTIDLFGYEPQNPQKPVANPLEAIKTLAKDQPHHPYSFVGEAHISSTLSEFLALTADLGLPFTRAGEDRNILLPSPAGAVRPAYLVPQAQVAGDLARSEPILIIGFEGLRDFYPLLIAENLAKAGYQVRALRLPMDLLTARKDANTVQLAEALEDGARRSRLGQTLKEVAKPGERIGLPAILGLNKHTEVFADLEKISGVPLFEIPTMPPSVPGIRLYVALRDYLQSKGVRVEPAMEVINADKNMAENGTAGKVNWLESATSARPLKHRATHYLLATGGILGGGFNSDANGRVWEVILDLPLTVPQDRSEWFSSQFLNPDGHPVFKGGVQVNADFQPVNSEGKLLYENLWVAGQMVTGANPILERSIEGIAIITGMAAGKAISSR